MQFQIAILSICIFIKFPFTLRNIIYIYNCLIEEILNNKIRRLKLVILGRYSLCYLSLKIFNELQLLNLSTRIREKSFHKNDIIL